MKRIAIILAAIAVFCSCNSNTEPKVMARYVPERMDDFIMENNLIAARIYGQALEGNPTSPGIDVWVKMPGALVADEWYKHFQLDGDEEYYHHNHGGKDCYKVAVSLGAGASAAVVDGKLILPSTNYRSYDILEQSADKVVFVLHYPQWEADGLKISLDKKITVTADTHFFKCEDSYNFEGAEQLMVVAGINRHTALQTIEEELCESDRYALWEKASDTHAEPEDGRIGVAVYVPEAQMRGLLADESHGVCGRVVSSGETFTYYFGNCWSAADIKNAADWFNMVKGL